MTDKSGILKWEERGRIGILRISSGKKGNAIPRPDFADPEIVKRWINRENIEGILVTGEARHFSSGADLSYFTGCEFTTEEIGKLFEAGREIINGLENIEKPVIAAIDGACLGAGLEIALACQLRYCSQKAIFGFPEVSHEIIPGYGGLQRLLAIAGKSRTLEIALTGEVFGAEYARQFGIVNAITEDKTAFDHALEVLGRIVEMGRKPVQYTIRAVNNALRKDFESAMKEECHMFAELVIEQYVNGGGDIGGQEKNKAAG